VIQASKLVTRYELADREWIAIKPKLPNKPRGVSRVNDRRVLNGIFWVLRSGDAAASSECPLSIRRQAGPAKPAQIPSHAPAL